MKFVAKLLLRRMLNIGNKLPSELTAFRTPQRAPGMHEPPNYDSDTTPVRAGEELNLVWLEEHLRSRLPEECLPEPERTRAPIEVRQFPGGHSNLTYLIRFGSRELVLRRPPFGPVAPTASRYPPPLLVSGSGRRRIPSSSPR